MTRFISCNKPNNISHIAKLFLREVRLHGLPLSIVSGKDVKFVSYGIHSENCLGSNLSFHLYLSCFSGKLDYMVRLRSST